ncbi:MAG: M14 family metallopeptidase, partial [Candidatus Marinimicrobia bacterium]|nr:M14 family metallopeptidase [Candidatus Neomarinimicrobiota bacterium]
MGRRTANRYWPVLLLLPLAAAGQQKIDWTAPLPPALPWSGNSEALIVSDDDPWITPSERSGLTTTPTYDQTMAYLRRLADASSVIHLLSIGKSAQGRDIIMVVMAANGGSTPGAFKREGKPTLLVQAGIHAGEIDGKDAGLMLLRDIAVRGIKADLLNNVNLLFIPILSVDGHERRSPYNRINQRGPEGQGWRTNSRNLNLNRDYAKLDTREVRAIVKVINQWAPDLYLDLHVTDGIDYQYDITFGHAGNYSWSPSIAGWLENYLTPALNDDLSAEGHIPGPLVFAVDNRDPGKGTREWTPSPRYSDGYGAARHLPTVLVENHSLKPYRQRVLGTYVLLESAMRTLSRYGDRLSRAVTADQSRESKRVPLGWRVADDKSEMIPFLGVEWAGEPSDISGGQNVVWSGVPTEINLPHASTIVPTATVRRPKAYWIPPAWDDVIDRLRMHGIFMQEMDRSRT